MVENVTFRDRRRVLADEVTQILGGFLQSKRDHGVDISSSAKLRKLGGHIRVKLTAEKEMALTLVLAGIPEESEEDRKRALEYDRRDAKAQRKVEKEQSKHKRKSDEPPKAEQTPKSKKRSKPAQEEEEEAEEETPKHKKDKKKKSKHDNNGEASSSKKKKKYDTQEEGEESSSKKKRKHADDAEVETSSSKTHKKTKKSKHDE